MINRDNLNLLVNNFKENEIKRHEEAASFLFKTNDSIEQEMVEAAKEGNIYVRLEFPIIDVMKYIKYNRDIKFIRLSLIKKLEELYPDIKFYLDTHDESTLYAQWGDND